MKMRAVRKSAEDGLVFSGSDINKYNANILEQLHLAHLDGVDINRYIKDNFDAEQLEQIRICLKEGIDVYRDIGFAQIFAMQATAGNGIRHVHGRSDQGQPFLYSCG